MQKIALTVKTHSDKLGYVAAASFWPERLLNIYITDPEAIIPAAATRVMRQTGCTSLETLNPSAGYSWQWNRVRYGNYLRRQILELRVQA